ncbi:transglutaminase [Paenibacillus sp. IB182496]|uniref:Transglutaminase n=1 Tax=Paenibacillus sabuli TaxID=2772509 RepID=A0A927BYA2_9BACL|nr:transglutaminase domain-containing protein [Paenibacillus sabuli]MBD2847840.1 transglutaminase [Paenibacillus sabuli]
MARVAAKWGVLAMLVVVAVGWDIKFGPVNADASRIVGLQELERTIAKQLKQRQEALVIEYVGDQKALSKQLAATVKRAIAADDYTAYVVDSYHYTITSWPAHSRIELSIAYRESPRQTAVVDRRVEQVLHELLRPDMNDHQKVKAIHDWIVRHVAYDESLSRYTAYEALTEGRAVCQGYALLAQRMLEAAGVESRIVEGTVNTGDHAWNLVNVNGAWYHLDVTWDDPVPDRPGEVSYAYYLLNDAQMREHHAWTRSYPAAVRDYAQTLQRLKERDPQRLAFYTTVERETGLIWLRPEHTAGTPAELETRLADAVAGGERNMTVRYTRGERVEADVKAAVLAVGAISSYRIRYSDFGAAGGVLLKLDFQLDERAA